jgi:DNA-binding response OmpR family regulator
MANPVPRIVMHEPTPGLRIVRPEVADPPVVVVTRLPEGVADTDLGGLVITRVVVELEPTGATEPPAGGLDKDVSSCIRLDRERRSVLMDGRPLDLTFLQFELLGHLIANPYRVHSRKQLLSAVWEYPPATSCRTVDVHIARLRRTLGPFHRDAIVAVRGVGYKYLPPLC